MAFLEHLLGAGDLSLAEAAETTPGTDDLLHGRWVAPGVQMQPRQWKFAYSLRADMTTDLGAGRPWELVR